MKNITITLTPNEVDALWEAVAYQMFRYDKEGKDSTIFHQLRDNISKASRNADWEEAKANAIEVARVYGDKHGRFRSGAEFTLNRTFWVFTNEIGEIAVVTIKDFAYHIDLGYGKKKRTYKRETNAVEYLNSIGYVMVDKVFNPDFTKMAVIFKG